MIPRQLAMSLAAGALLLAAAPHALAEEEAAPIYGHQLMTQEEQEQYRSRMRVLETEQERAALREQHRKEMQARAREREVEVELPDVAAPAGEAKGESPKTVRGREMMTEEEREQARREKHEEMKERARDMEFPDQPMPRGSGGGRRGVGSGGPGQGGRR